LREFPSLPQVATDGRIRALNSMENDIVRSQFLCSQKKKEKQVKITVNCLLDLLSSSM
jgi:hypothetical protein